MSDVLLGLVGCGYVLIAADQSVSRSIVVYKQSEDKILAVDANKLLGCAGPQGDRTHFTEYIEKNVALYALRTGVRLTPNESAIWASETEPGAWWLTESARASVVTATFAGVGTP